MAGDSMGGMGNPKPEPDLFEGALREARALYAMAEVEADESVDRIDLAIKAGVTGAFAALKTPDER